MNFYTDLIGISPILAVSLAGLVVVIIEALVKKSETLSYIFSIISLIIAGFLSVYTYPMYSTAFNGMVAVGGYASFFDFVFSIGALLTILLSKDYLVKRGTNYGEFYILILFATAGMMLLASGLDLIITFLGIELMSISLYVLAGFVRTDPKSNEAALKYLLLGAFATGFLLFGITFIYGSTTTTNLKIISANFQNYQNDFLFWLGAGLLLIGFSFKVAAVPFHMWAPDAYEGAPTPASGFMSAVSKSAAFGAFVLVFIFGFNGANEQVRQAIAIISVLSMILGNIIAISQTNIKRILAYSSIAHAGYILVGLASANELGKQGVLYYSLAYVLMQVGAFGIVSIIEKEENKSLDIKDYVGLGYRKPLLGVLMAIFMFALTGFPPFAGFVGKYYLFASAVQAGMTWLAVVGVLATLVSVYYYLNVVVNMYLKEPTLEIVSNPDEVKISFSGAFAVIISAVGVFLIGILPSFVTKYLERLF
ncbi:MAG: NADH-quinone oxidoreductase subunit N [Candidatus Kryptonium sp.]|nr:NADH-quinone oxidoreductase subunit N [Candidatus Kryptonium sp.]MDW8109704.1 NADH-quinone oxidoreductase subunit N [Candidatus Kryptonium sp.]